MAEIQGKSILVRVSGSQLYPRADSNWRGNRLFCVVLAVFARLLVTQQRRGNGRWLVHKMTNGAFEKLEKARFFFWCSCHLRVISIDESYSLWNISREIFFQILKKPSGHSRGILVVSCEAWRWAALLVDGLQDLFVKQSYGKMTAFWDAEQLEDEDYGSLPFIKKFRKFWLGIFGR